MTERFSSRFQYDVALSFAGEDRDFGSFIADNLLPEFKVFYDDFEKAALWGSDLSESLPARYLSSRYCVIIQSEEYLQKLWTTLERQAIVYEFLRRRGTDYVLPILVRNCSSSITGVSGLTGYLTAQSSGDWPNILELLRQKRRS
jgi:hypothetical protein